MFSFSQELDIFLRKGEFLGKSVVIDLEIESAKENEKDLGKCSDFLAKIFILGQHLLTQLESETELLEQMDVETELDLHTECERRIKFLLNVMEFTAVLFDMFALKEFPESKGKMYRVGKECHMLIVSDPLPSSVSFEDVCGSDSHVSRFWGPN